VGAAHQRACQGLREAHADRVQQLGGGPASRYAAKHQDKIQDVCAEVVAVRCGKLRPSEAAEGRLRLDPRVGRLVLRVKSVGSGGRLVLEGRDKKTVRDHVES
jgi:hypothetical protein